MPGWEFSTWVAPEPSAMPEIEIDELESSEIESETETSDSISSGDSYNGSESRDSDLIPTQGPGNLKRPRDCEASASAPTTQPMNKKSRSNPAMEPGPSTDNNGVVVGTNTSTTEDIWGPSGAGHERGVEAYDSKYSTTNLLNIYSDRKPQYKPLISS